MTQILGRPGSTTLLDATGYEHDDLHNALADMIEGSFTNEIMNFPSMEGADNAQPEWWEEADGNATLTEVDIAGESITETYERGLKVVVASANSHAYQRFTYSDQPRLKSGVKVSLLVAVWSVSSVSARVRLQSSVGSLGVSSDTTAAAWTLLRVDGVTLDGTYVDVRLEVDVGTAYFVPLGFRVGQRAIWLPPRPLSYRSAESRPTIESLSGQASKAFADVDLTANTSPLAVMAKFLLSIRESATTTDEYAYGVRPNGSATALTAASIRRGWVRGDVAESDQLEFTERLDDQQIIETGLHQYGGTTIDDCVLFLLGWWEWA